MVKKIPREKEIKNLPNYKYINATDLPGKVQMVANASAQDTLVLTGSANPRVIRADDVNKDEILVVPDEEQLACEQAYSPEATKINTNDQYSRVKRVIDHEPVVTPFKFTFETYLDRNRNYKPEIPRTDRTAEQDIIIQDAEGEDISELDTNIQKNFDSQNYTQADVMCLSSWVRKYIPGDFTVNYESRDYDGGRYLMVLLMYRQEVYPLNIEEAELLQEIVDTYAFNAQAWLLDASEDIIYRGKLIPGHWLASVLPHLEMHGIDIIGSDVVTSDIYNLPVLYNTLIENIYSMYLGGYLVAIPLYHTRILTRWQLKGSGVEIGLVDPSSRVLVHGDWMDTRFASDKLKLLQDQLAGDSRIWITIEKSDVLRYTVSSKFIDLDIQHKYHDQYIVIQCDNLDDARLYANMIEDVQKSLGSFEVSVVYVTDDVKNVEKLIDETSVLYSALDTSDITQGISDSRLVLSKIV